MARIRIVDEWLRSPASPPTHYRSIMVVAERWAEQRVLMRAYAESADQTRPTIVLHGTELAIGPASTDPNGSWGIHVQPPVDGRRECTWGVFNKPPAAPDPDDPCGGECCSGYQVIFQVDAAGTIDPASVICNAPG